MGLEAKCTADIKRRKYNGKALLETDAIYFRGETSLKIPLKEIQEFDARAGVLHLKTPSGAVALHLGKDAEKWYLKIRYPKSLLDKLGVKPGQKVAILNLDAPDFVADLRSRTTEISEGRMPKAVDLIFFHAAEASELSRLGELRSHIAADGGIWVLAPKGVKQIREADVLAAGKKHGLVDIKVVSFSEKLTAHKFVIPVKDRKL